MGKKKKFEELNKGEVIIYKHSKNKVELRVQFKDETVWLTQAQIAFLFNVERSVITKHLRNIFKSKELDRNSVCAKIAHTAPDGKIYKTQFNSFNYAINKINFYAASLSELGSYRS